MRWLHTWLLLGTVCCWSGVAGARLQILPDREPQAVFAGVGRPVHLVFQNPDAQALAVNLRTQLYQASSATAVPIGKPRDWKQLRMLPGQTVLETIPLDFPAVRAQTRFLVQWLDDRDEVLGNTDVLVYPTNLLQAMLPLANSKPLGVFDPGNQLKPLLKFPNLEIEDLENTGVAGFSGALAIIGPYAATNRLPENLSSVIEKLAKSGVAVVWIQPPSGDRRELAPSFYAVPFAKCAVVVVQSELVAGLADNPRAQLDLIEFARLALHPEPIRLPCLATQP